MVQKNRLQGKKPPVEELEEKHEPPAVSAGSVGMVVDYIFNPSRDKIREVTVINAMQASLLPQLDIVSLLWNYVVEIACFRRDAVSYEKEFEKKRPIPPNLIEEFTYRTAQWNKSIGAQNMKAGIDLALAEMETKGEDEGFGGQDSFDEK